MKVVRTKDLLELFNLTLIGGEDGIHRKITSSDISRPGIEMTGYFEYYKQERIQILGKTEMAYFLNLSEEEQLDRAKRLCTDVTPGIIITNNMEVPDVILEEGIKEITGSYRSVHICGSTNRIWPDLATCGMDAFSVDNCEDLLTLALVHQTIVYIRKEK